MRKVDIRQVKTDLRNQYKKFRREMDPVAKEEADAQILRRVTGLYQYRQAQMVLTYVSTPIEVDTLALIRQAWQDGKTVCVPRCREGERLMDFYRIREMEDLERGAFGVWEPIPAPLRESHPVWRTASVWCPGWALTISGSGWDMGKGIMTGSCPAMRGVKWEFAIRSVSPTGCPGDGMMSRWICWPPPASCAGLPGQGNSR